MKDLPQNAHIHLMGVCGTAMASLAALLKERGFRITGSDRNVYPPMSTFLENHGIKIMEDYKASNLEPAPDYVVVGNVIAERYEEAQALLKSSIPYASLPETLRDFVIEDRHSIVCAGTHGKTTTTSMMAWICEQEGLQPGFLIGGIPKNFQTSFKNPKGQHFVVEGDEYDTAFFAKKPKFLFYKPRSVILSGVEFDHADIYNGLDDVLQAFESLMKIIPEDDGLLVYNGEDDNIKKILSSYQGKKVSYGYKDSDWSIGTLSYLRDGLSFEVLHKGKLEEKLFVPMFGQYNAMNALSVYALAKERGFSHSLKESFAEFKGVRRRQELIGEPNGIQVIEDFAHHPTAVRGTIDSFLKREGRGKLFVVFEPRSNTSRRKIFQKQYTEALRGGDRVLISEPFMGTKPLNPEESLNVAEIVRDLGGAKKARSFVEVEDAIDQIQGEAVSGDTVLIMSNGGFQGIYSKLLNALEVG